MLTKVVINVSSCTRASRVAWTCTSTNKKQAAGTNRFRQRMGTTIAWTCGMCLAVPGEVLRTYDREGVLYADVRFGDVMKRVCVHAVPDVTAGDYVLVHVGFAIAKIDREAAAQALQTLAQLGELEPDEGDA